MNKLLTEVIRMKTIMGLTENLNLADKLFFRPGKLSPEVREGIVGITEGNNFTNLVASLYYHFKQDGQYDQGIMSMCEEFNDELINYDKNLFPVPGNLTDYGLDVQHDGFHVLTLAELLKNRNLLVYQWSKVSSLIKRNILPLIKNELYAHNPGKGTQHEQTNLTYAFKAAAKILQEINETLKVLSPKKFEEIVPKLFSSHIRTLTELHKGITNLKNTLSMMNSNMGFTKDNVYENAAEYGCKIVKDDNNIMIVKVISAEAMQALGCFSSWCFAVPGGDEYWDDYAPRGYVYIIYDFSMDVEDSRFMMVYLPDTNALYLSNNQQYDEVHRDMNSTNYLYKLGIDAGTELR